MTSSIIINSTTCTCSFLFFSARRILDAEANRTWSTSSSSDSDKEEPLRGRSSRKLDVADSNIEEEPSVYEDNMNANATLSFNGFAKLHLHSEKVDQLSVVFDNEQGSVAIYIFSVSSVSEGIWKCRICCWTYKSGTPWIDHIQETTINHWDQCFFCEIRGVGFKHLFSDSEPPNDVQGLIFEKNNGDEVFSPITEEPEAERSPFDEINHQHEENNHDSSPSEHLLQPSEESSNGFIVEKSSTEILSVTDEVNLLKETDYEETEYDVETVLDKQNTHDLYCPNCRSCITRRVILCKRKRTVKISKDPKRNKLDTVADLNVDSTGGQGGGSTSTDNGADRDKDPEVFRCLSCFSFFMPSGNCFRPFQVLPETETENIEKNKTAPKKYWWQFMFNFGKEQTSETGHSRDLPIGDIGTPLLIPSPNDSSSTPANGDINKTELDNGRIGEVVVNVVEKPDGAIDNGRGTQSDSKSEFVTHTEYHAGNAVSTQQEDGRKFFVTEGVNTYKVFEDTKKDNHEEENISGDLAIKKKQVDASHDSGSAIEDENFLNKIKTNILPSGVARPPVIGTKVDIHIEKPLNDNAGGSDTFILIQNRPNEHIVPRSPEDVIDVGNIVAPEIIRHTRGVNGLEIVKSIVYGGLIESITSLGIVSSSAGSDATTLNIVALSIANLIGGIILIIHNIWDLKAEHDADSSTVRRGDRYQEILGRRQNFWVHATFALLSFVVFGLIPPVIYGFSFRVSDDKDFKLIAVAVGALVCISLLGIGKAYVQKLSAKGYVKTIVYYVVSGFMVSGITYVAGKYMKQLLEELGLFESTEALNMPSIIQTMATETPWKSFY
ncbi:membrane protein of ER body-like protein [Impatiens glandulifera]|uniref:membrane protein of ER body-like protein n=1 Tax=Impatiens glandulifera TaxID=253017 RepID=UPI001FB12881|nr:membrane protein of ER body-like protein [Impatiens glandulifera]